MTKKSDSIQATTSVSEAGVRSPDQFAVGDIVYLRGGSPRLTVMAVTQEGLCTPYGATYVVSVAWFDDLKLMHEDFPTADLVKTPPIGPGEEQPY